MDATEAQKVATAEGTAEPVVITVNGTSVAVRRSVLPYRDILALAGHGPLSSAQPPVSVQYPPTSVLRNLVIAPESYAVVTRGMSITVGQARQG